MPQFLPRIVAHADWSCCSRKRWVTLARLIGGGRYEVYDLDRVERFVGENPLGATLKYHLSGFIPVLKRIAGADEAIFVGFDFPIGLPCAYAQKTGVSNFLNMLPRLGSGRWRDFYVVAESKEQISLYRPFYPDKRGEKDEHKQQYVMDKLDLKNKDDLRRLCERRTDWRTAACPLFWTLGGNQVGKAALSGWREVLSPALRDRTLGVVVWPFDGRFPDLFRPGKGVIAETYPGEAYHHLGISFPRGKGQGKRNQRDRKNNAPKLLSWARKADLTIMPQLRSQIEGGFGGSRDGEDPFDAVAGLFGMLNVVLGLRPPGEPEEDHIRKVEGWILGQQPTAG